MEVSTKCISCDQTIEDNGIAPACGHAVHLSCLFESCVKKTKWETACEQCNASISLTPAQELQQAWYCGAAFSEEAAKKVFVIPSICGLIAVTSTTAMALLGGVVVFPFASASSFYKDDPVKGISYGVLALTSAMTIQSFFDENYRKFFLDSAGKTIEGVEKAAENFGASPLGRSFFGFSYAACKGVQMTARAVNRTVSRLLA